MIEKLPIHVLRHKSTGLLAAVSDDLLGLNVIGRTIEEIIDELPVCLEALLSKAKGAEVCVLGVEIDPDTQKGWAEYETVLIAAYQLKAA